MTKTEADNLPIVGALVAALRTRGLKVGMQETLSLTAALSQDLHGSSYLGFHDLARALLVHSESDLDEFEKVFSHVFKGVPLLSNAISDELRAWLRDPKNRPDLTDEERAELETLTPDELLRRFEERRREQTGRHDGGNHWIGTGGRSPFGTGGVNPSGLSLRGQQPGSTPGSGGRSSIQSADHRRYRPYRQDMTLDVRQIEVALRKLRTFDRTSHAAELDLEKTIDSTARNFGELDLVFRKPRKPNTRVILLMDVGGTMDPFTNLVSQLFSAAKRATHFKELRTYYFHNCVYGRVFQTDRYIRPVAVRDLLRECDQRYHLIFVGDATMAPYELTSPSSFSGLDWLYLLRRHFPKSAWFNPDAGPAWRGSTRQTIAQVFPMFPLTLQGLEEGISHLANPRRGAGSTRTSPAPKMG
mgnify:CR=1 FL=1